MKETLLKNLFIKQLEKEGFKVLHGKKGSSFVYSPHADVVSRKNNKCYVFEVKATGTLELHYYQMHRAIGQCLHYFMNLRAKGIYTHLSEGELEEFLEDFDIEEVDLSNIKTIYLVMSSKDEYIKKLIEFFNLPIKLITFRPPYYTEIQPQL